MRPEEQDRVLAAAMKAQYRGSASPGPDCVDAEVVAAFLDRTLSSSERTRWESHITGCAYCTSLLSAAARADHASSRELSTRPRWWLLPAVSSIVAATTAAVFLYVRAANHEAAAPTMELAEKGAEDLAYRANEAKSEEAAPLPAPKAPQPQERDEFRVESHRGAEAKPKLAQRTLRKGEVESETVAVETSNQVVSAGAGANRPGDTNLQKFAVAVPAASNQDAREPIVSGQLSAQHPIAEVSAPDGSVRWALRKGGSIERSSGRNGWVAQASGVRSDLLAGSAPSPNVCWVVGRDGVILRTADGEHWEKLTSPVTSDLVAVSAKSADAATITTIGGDRYATDDGAATWHPL